VIPEQKPGSSNPEAGGEGGGEQTEGQPPEGDAKPMIVPEEEIWHVLQQTGREVSNLVAARCEACMCICVCVCSMCICVCM